MARTTPIASSARTARALLFGMGVLLLNAPGDGHAQNPVCTSPVYNHTNECLGTIQANLNWAPDTSLPDNGVPDGHSFAISLSGLMSPDGQYVLGYGGAAYAWRGDRNGLEGYKMDLVCVPGFAIAVAANALLLGIPPQVAYWALAALFSLTTYDMVAPQTPGSFDAYFQCLGVLLEQWNDPETGQPVIEMNFPRVYWAVMQKDEQDTFWPRGMMFFKMVHPDDPLVDIGQTSLNLVIPSADASIPPSVFPTICVPGVPPDECGS